MLHAGAAWYNFCPLLQPCQQSTHSHTGYAAGLQDIHRLLPTLKIHLQMSCDGKMPLSRNKP